MGDAAILRHYPKSGTLRSDMIREAVRSKLKASGWTLLKLSQESGVTYRAIHDWLSDNGAGKRGPSVDNVVKIMRTLGLSVCDAKPAKKRPRP